MTNRRRPRVPAALVFFHSLNFGLDVLGMDLLASMARVAAMILETLLALVASMAIVAAMILEALKD